MSAVPITVPLDVPDRPPVAPSAPDLPDKLFVSDVAGRVGDRVVISGWVDSLRRRRGVTFVSLRDRTGTVQVVVRDGADRVADLPGPPGPAVAGTPARDREWIADPSAGLTAHSAVRVAGTVRPCAAARYGPVEIHATGVEVLAPAGPVPDLVGAGAETRADLRHLDLRTRAGALRFEVQTTLVAAMRDRLLARRFIELHTPRITAGGSESGAAVFEVGYFGETACLAQSPQLALQVAMAAGLDRVFDIGPVFRAEAGGTNRHATEFTSVDVELSWIDSVDDVMDVAEDLLTHGLAAVAAAHGAEIRDVFGVPVEVPDGPIPRLEAPTGRSGRLTHRDEQELCRQARRRSGHSLVFVTGYPVADRPFYTHRDGPGDATRSFDLLWSGMEVSSGCQREHRADRLAAQAADAGLGSEAMARYLDRFWLPMFDHGCPPHGGFGFGLDRLLMAVCGLGSIREASFLARDAKRYVP